MEAAEGSDGDALLEAVEPLALPEVGDTVTYSEASMDPRVSVTQVPISLLSASQTKAACSHQPSMQSPVTAYNKRTSGSKHALRQQAKRRRKNTTIAAGLHHVSPSLARVNAKAFQAHHTVQHQPYRSPSQTASKVQTIELGKAKEDPEVIDLLNEEEEVVVLPDIGVQFDHDEDEVEETEEPEEFEDAEGGEERHRLIYGGVAHQSTMREVLASIPGFRMRRNKRGLKRNTKTQKLSAAAQLRQTEEGLIDLETPDSILVNTNLRALLNKHTLSMLPPLYQHKLTQLLPSVDRVLYSSGLSKIAPSGLNNEFFARACHEWRDRLSEGEFTSENQQRLRAEAEREKNRLDPWKLKHFEPIWGWRHRTTLPPQPIPAPHQPESVVENVTRAPIRTTIKLRNTASASSTPEKPVPAPAPVDPVQLARRLRSDGAVTRAVSNYRHVVASAANAAASSAAPVNSSTTNAVSSAPPQVSLASSTSTATSQAISTFATPSKSAIDPLKPTLQLLKISSESTKVSSKSSKAILEVPVSTDVFTTTAPPLTLSISLVPTETSVSSKSVTISSPESETMTVIKNEQGVEVKRESSLKEAVEANVESEMDVDEGKVQIFQCSEPDTNSQKRSREGDGDELEGRKKLRSSITQLSCPSPSLFSPEIIAETRRESICDDDASDPAEMVTVEGDAISGCDETEAEAEESFLSEDRTTDDVSSMEMDISQTSIKMSPTPDHDRDTDEEGCAAVSVLPSSHFENSKTDPIKENSSCIAVDSSVDVSLKTEHSEEECKDSVHPKYDFSDLGEHSGLGKNVEDFAEEKLDTACDIGEQNKSTMFKLECHKDQTSIKDDDKTSKDQENHSFESTGDLDKSGDSVQLIEKTGITNFDSLCPNSMSSVCDDVVKSSLDGTEKTVEDEGIEEDDKDMELGSKLDDRTGSSDIEEVEEEEDFEVKTNEAFSEESQECNIFNLSGAKLFKDSVNVCGSLEQKPEDNLLDSYADADELVQHRIQNEIQTENDETGDVSDASDDVEDSQEVPEDVSDIGSPDCDVSLGKPYMDASDLSSTSAPQIDSDWDGVDSSTEKLLEDLEAQAANVSNEGTDALSECNVLAVPTHEMEVGHVAGAFSSTTSLPVPALVPCVSRSNDLPTNSKHIPINDMVREPKNSSESVAGTSPEQFPEVPSERVKLELEVTLTPDVNTSTEGAVSSSSTAHTTMANVLPPTTIVCLPSAMSNTAPSIRPNATAPLVPPNTGIVVRAAGSGVVSTSALPYIALSSNTSLRAITTSTPTLLQAAPQFRPKQRNKESAQTGKGRRNNPSKPPPGAVNLERSYQICQAVIQNSPNRDQLRFQLKPPPSLLASGPGKTSADIPLEKVASTQTQYGAVSSSRGPRNVSPNIPPTANSGLNAGPALIVKQGKTRQQSPSAPVLVRHVFTSQQGIPVTMAVNVLPQSQSSTSTEGGENIAPAVGQMAQYILLQRTDQRALKRGTPPRASSAPPSNNQVISGVAGAARGRPSSVDADCSQPHQQVYGQQQGPSPGVQAVTRSGQEGYSVPALPDHIPGAYPQVILHGPGQAQGQVSGGGSTGHSGQALQEQHHQDTGSDANGSKNDCSCNLKAMIMCKQCGAFCHDDCIGPMHLCVMCYVSH